jgi:hypothetical protein
MDVLNPSPQSVQVNNLNAFIANYKDSVLCGPDCQKEKTIQELQQKYLDAEKNLQTAPEQLSEAAKNYYTFSGGNASYNSYVEKTYQKDADKITEKLKKQFLEKMEEVKNAHSSLDGNIINTKNSIELYVTLKKENKKLEHTLKKNGDTIVTNDRKTYYEEQSIENIQFQNRIFFWMYILFFISLAGIVVTSSLSLFYKCFIIASFVLYPFIFPYLFAFVFGLLKKIYEYLPHYASLSP